MICKLAAFFGVDYIDFIFSFIFFLGFVKVLKKKIFFLFSFSFLSVQQVLELLRLLDHGVVAKIKCLYTPLPIQRQVLTNSAYMGFMT
jgi:hypothetical protein